MSIDEHYYHAVQYQLLADYFKYVDPEKHIHFYKMHYFHFHKWLQRQHYREDEETNPVSLSKIRVVHASPGTAPLDIFMNEETIWRDLRYKNSSVYIETDKMDIQISILKTGSTGSPILSGMIQITPDNSYTLAIAGTGDDLQLILIEDDPSVPQSEAKLRFWHLSAEAPAVDIAVKKGDVVFSNIKFTELSEYLGLTPMTVDLEVRLSGTKDVILPLSRVSLKPDLAYTIVAVGNINDKPELETIFLVP